MAIPAEYSSYTPSGNLKSREELEALAATVVPQLTPPMRAAMLAMVNGAPGWRDAIPVRAQHGVVYSLEKFGITSGFSRSGDNAMPFQPLGVVVRDLLASPTSVGESGR